MEHRKRTVAAGEISAEVEERGELSRQSPPRGQHDGSHLRDQSEPCDIGGIFQAEIHPLAAVQRYSEGGGGGAQFPIEEEPQTDPLRECFHRVGGRVEKIAAGIELVGDDIVVGVRVGEMKQRIPVLQRGIGAGQRSAFGPEGIRRGEIKLGNEHGLPVETAGEETPRSGDCFRNR